MVNYREKGGKIPRNEPKNDAEKQSSAGLSTLS